MKKFIIGALFLTIAAAAFVAGSRFGQGNGSAERTPGGRRVLYYVDPMNPAHISHKPGLAPCGMKMEPVYAEAALNLGSTNGQPPWPPGTVNVSPAKQQLIGVRVAPAERKALHHSLRLLGRVAADETRIYRLNAAVSGWITKAGPYATGSLVKKDAALAAFYSPEFLSAGQALLFALNSKDRVQKSGLEIPGQQSQLDQFHLNIKQYADSLKNLGMSELQIEEMTRTRKFADEVKLLSPADGFVLSRNISVGQRFDKGTELFRIADLSHVWVLVDLFEQDAGLVQAEPAAKVSVSIQGQVFPAALSKDLPQFDAASRTLKLRLEADNPEFVLKPDMFVDADIPIRLPETVVIPREAVLNSGLRRTVFVDRGSGFFEPRLVETGRSFGDEVQILNGITPGERIVVSGNFLLDSESRMRLAAAGVPGSQSGQSNVSIPASGSQPSRVTDPVCGMTVDEAEARGEKCLTEHQGQTYFFCCTGCKDRFAANPARFLKSAGLTNAPAVSTNSPPHRDQPSH
jgi:membrane fusion protein, copper/silver efflux system